MEWRRAVRNLGTRFLFAATVVLALIVGLSIHRFVWDRDRELRHELVAHHFERSSWFAMNAAKYEELDPDLYPDKDRTQRISACLSNNAETTTT
jgi:hypothetical protein